MIWKFISQGLSCLLTFTFNPVRRDRWLFGSKSKGMIIFAVTIVIIVPFIIFCGLKVHSHFNKTIQINKLLLNKEDTALSSSTPCDSVCNDLWSIISQYTDPGNLPEAKTSTGRFWALICAIAGIFCISGFAVSSFVSAVNRMTEKWNSGMFRYDTWFNKYVVIIGVNKQTSSIIKNSLKRNNVKYVLIQTRQNVEKMRKRLYLDLNKEEEKKIVFYNAERISNEDIEQLHLDKAVEVYILGEDMFYENEEDHDAFNIECLEHISKYISKFIQKSKRTKKFGNPLSKYISKFIQKSNYIDKRTKKFGNEQLTCYVNFEYQSTFTAFKATNIYKKLDKVVKFIPFNIHEIWAKKVLVDNFAVVPSGGKGELSVQRYKPLDGDGITYDSNKKVRLIIMGMNQMGTALGLQAALLTHYPNFKRNRNLKTTITFIDDQALKEGDFFRGRFEALFYLCKYRNVNCKTEKLLYSPKTEISDMKNPLKSEPYDYLIKEEKEDNFMDIQWEFIEGNVADDSIKKYISDVADDSNNITTIAICFNNPQQSIATALYLPRTIFRDALQVLTYQQNSFDILNKVAEGEQNWKRYNNLDPFGMIDSPNNERLLDDTKVKILSLLLIILNLYYIILRM